MKRDRSPINTLTVTLFLNLFPLLFITNLTGCKDNSIGPDEIKLPGYQEDIQWSSIANTPWPKHRRDAQNTGRSPYSGPTGILNWTIDTSFYLNSELTLDAQNNLYTVSCVDTTGLYSYNTNGVLRWGTIYSRVQKIAITPLLTASGKIISADQGHIFCFNNNGEVEWVFNSDHRLFITGIALDKEGNLYFTDDLGTLYCLNESGNLNWSFTDSRFYNNEETAIGFSPDGKTIYLIGMEISLFAFDITSKQIKWSIDKGEVRSSPMIDSQGNIYFIAKNPESNYGLTFYSVTSQGQERFFHGFTSSYSHWRIDPTIDKNGNQFFAGDTLYSLDYRGNLRWKTKLLGFNLSPLINDKDGNIYLTAGGYPNLNQLLSYSNDGTLRWSIPSIIGSGYSVIGSNNNLYMNICQLSGTGNKLIYSIK
jgi:hypothetical protein